LEKRPNPSQKNALTPKGMNRGEKEPERSKLTVRFGRGKVSVGGRDEVKNLPERGEAMIFDYYEGVSL